MGYDKLSDNYRRSSIRALHIRSKLRRLISESKTDLDTAFESTEPTPPLTPVDGIIPRKSRKERSSNPWLDRWSSCIDLSQNLTEPAPAPIERYGSRSNLSNDFFHNDFYDPEFHLPSRIRFRETTELVPKLAVLPLRTRLTFSEALPPTQIINSIAYAATTKNHLSSNNDKVKSSSPVNESTNGSYQVSTSPSSSSSTKKEKEENIWDRITHIEPTPIATVTAEPARSGPSRPESVKSRLSDSSKESENQSNDKNRLGDELEKMRKELDRVKRENQEKDQLLKQAKLEKLAQTTSQDDKIRSDSCETEIFSTPPSSPQPPINSEKKSTQTNYSSKSNASESEENELLSARLQREEKFRQELEAELQRQKAESSKALNSFLSSLRQAYSG